MKDEGGRLGRRQEAEGRGMKGLKDEGYKAKG
jgi:hypothetical protein